MRTEIRARFKLLRLALRGAALGGRLKYLEPSAAAKLLAKLVEDGFKGVVLSRDWWTPALAEAYYRAVQRLAPKGDNAFVARVLGKRETLTLNLLRDVRGKFISGRVLTLAARLEGSLSGVSVDVSQRAARALADAQDRGLNAEKLAATLQAAADFGETRAQTIARTELTRAYAEGQLAAMEESGVEHATSLAEWNAATGSACSLCAPMAGHVVPVSAAYGMIPRHPNCMCAWVPYYGPAKGVKALARRAATQSLRAEGKTRRTSAWVGTEL